MILRDPPALHLLAAEFVELLNRWVGPVTVVAGLCAGGCCCFQCDSWVIGSLSCQFLASAFHMFDMLLALIRTCISRLQ